MMIGMQEIIADAAGIVMSVIGIVMTGINIVMSERDIVVGNGRERGDTAHDAAVQPEALVGAAAEAEAEAVAETAAEVEAEAVVVMWMSSGHPVACQTDQRLLLMKATGTLGLHEHDLSKMCVFSRYYLSHPLGANTLWDLNCLSQFSFSKAKICVLFLTT